MKDNNETDCMRVEIERLKVENEKLREAAESVAKANANAAELMVEMEEMRERLNTIVEATSAKFGKTFFQTLVEQLAKVFNASYVVIGEVISQDPREVRSVATWWKGKSIDNLEYETCGTPCEGVLDDDYCFFPTDVKSRFPKDTMLSELSIESYLGTSIYDLDKNRCGLIAIMDEKPMVEDLELHTILKVFARRVGMELDRIKLIESLHKSKKLAEDANRSKSIFLSSMSHELRTPMNSILGFAQLLESDQDETFSETKRGYVEQILKSGDHLLELIDEVLNLSGIESGKVQISMKEIGIDTAIKEVITTVKPIAQMNNITINYLTKCDEQYIRADRTRFKQILINLLSNAIKYNYYGGSVSICIEFPMDKMLRVNIEDTGPGIAKEKHDALFEPFNRLGAESLNIEGTGVGLTITKKLVEMMEGSIGVESEVGKGTKFYVDFKKIESPKRITGKK
jgi:signal transduction histidine kinase